MAISILNDLGTRIHSIKDPPSDLAAFRKDRSKELQGLALLIENFAAELLNKDEDRFESIFQDEENLAEILRFVQLVGSEISKENAKENYLSLRNTYCQFRKDFENFSGQCQEEGYGLGAATSIIADTSLENSDHRQETSIKTNALTSVLKNILSGFSFPEEKFSSGKVRLVLADWEYEKDGGWKCEAGLLWLRRNWSKCFQPTVILGFQKEKDIRLCEEGSLLDNEAIIYVRLPIKISELKKKIAHLKSVCGSNLDQKSVQRNLQELYKYLTENLAHGSLSSLKRNCHDILNDLKIREYESILKKLNLNSDRLHRAKLSLDRSKSKFKLPQKILCVLRKMDKILDSIEALNEKIIEKFNKGEVNIESQMQKINSSLNELNELKNLIAPK